MQIGKLFSNIDTNLPLKKAVQCNSHINHGAKADANVTKLMTSMGVNNMPLVNKSSKLSDLVFDKGIAKKPNGEVFSGIVKYTLKNGKDVEITYESGHWKKSRMSQKGTSYVIEKIAKYKDGKLASVNKIYLQNNEPMLAKFTKIDNQYVKTENVLDINTTTFVPVKKGQKLTADEMDKCFRADFFKDYNPEKYTGSAIIKEDKSRIFKQEKTSPKWIYCGIVDNLQRLMNNIKG